MKSLKDTIREELRKQLIDSEDQFHIIILFEKSNDVPDFLITEGKWNPSEYKGYWQRVDNPNFDFEQKHVHIAKQKHINTKAKQVSWNEDGTRHDKKSFNDNFNGMEKAKTIARNVLNLSNDITLENLTDNSKGLLLLESVQTLPEQSNVYIFKAIKENNTRVIKS
ncbi:DUF6367 family protein [Confluentibacter sediminis]|uniref:DUF6367 family protein n=1 Tax=Confluentibacter sediminis TaxID=2219045 RepID=UPI0013A6D91F|nr:DUF6367 family protein [Confluentibacter sediminis]